MSVLHGEYKDLTKGYWTDVQQDAPWFQTFRMTMRAPLVANQLFDTIEHLQEYVNDNSDKASAYEGQIVSVIGEDTKTNGVYRVITVKRLSTDPDGTFEKLDSNSKAIINVDENTQIETFDELPVNLKSTDAGRLGLFNGQLYRVKPISSVSLDFSGYLTNIENEEETPVDTEWLVDKINQAAGGVLVTQAMFGISGTMFYGGGINLNLEIGDLIEIHPEDIINNTTYITNIIIDACSWYPMKGGEYKYKSYNDLYILADDKDGNSYKSTYSLPANYHTKPDVITCDLSEQVSIENPVDYVYISPASVSNDDHCVLKSLTFDLTSADSEEDYESGNFHEMYMWKAIGWDEVTISDSKEPTEETTNHFYRFMKDNTIHVTNIHELPAYEWKTDIACTSANTQISNDQFLDFVNVDDHNWATNASEGTNLYQAVLGPNNDFTPIRIGTKSAGSITLECTDNVTLVFSQYFNYNSASDSYSGDGVEATITIGSQSETLPRWTSFDELTYVEIPVTTGTITISTSRRVYLHSIYKGGGGGSEYEWDQVLKRSDVADVAISGDYNDLVNKPAIGDVHIFNSEGLPNPTDDHKDIIYKVDDEMYKIYHGEGWNVNPIQFSEKYPNISMSTACYKMYLHMTDDLNTTCASNSFFDSSSNVSTSNSVGRGIQLGSSSQLGNFTSQFYIDGDSGFRFDSVEVELTKFNSKDELNVTIEIGNDYEDDIVTKDVFITHDDETQTAVVSLSYTGSNVCNYLNIYTNQRADGEGATRCLITSLVYHGLKYYNNEESAIITYERNTKWRDVSRSKWGVIDDSTLSTGITRYLVIDSSEHNDISTISNKYPLSKKEAYVNVNEEVYNYNDKNYYIWRNYDQNGDETYMDTYLDDGVTQVCILTSTLDPELPFNVNKDAMNCLISDSGAEMYDSSSNNPCVALVKEKVNGKSTTDMANIGVRMYQWEGDNEKSKRSGQGIIDFYQYNGKTMDYNGKKCFVWERYQNNQLCTDTSDDGWDEDTAKKLLLTNTLWIKSLPFDQDSEGFEGFITYGDDYDDIKFDRIEYFPDRNYNDGIDHNVVKRTLVLWGGVSEKEGQKCSLTRNLQESFELYINENEETYEYNGQKCYVWRNYDGGEYDSYNIMLLTTTLEPKLPLTEDSDDFVAVLSDYTGELQEFYNEIKRGSLIGMTKEYLDGTIKADIANIKARLYNYHHSYDDDFPDDYYQYDGETMEYNGKTCYLWRRYDSGMPIGEATGGGSYYAYGVLTNTLWIDLPLTKSSPEYVAEVNSDGSDYVEVDDSMYRFAMGGTGADLGSVANLDRIIYYDNVKYSEKITGMSYKESSYDLEMDTLMKYVVGTNPQNLLQFVYTGGTTTYNGKKVYVWYPNTTSYDTWSEMYTYTRDVRMPFSFTTDNEQFAGWSDLYEIPSEKEVSLVTTLSRTSDPTGNPSEIVKRIVVN